MGTMGMKNGGKERGKLKRSKENKQVCVCLCVCVSVLIGFEGCPSDDTESLVTEEVDTDFEGDTGT